MKGCFYFIFWVLPLWFSNVTVWNTFSQSKEKMDWLPTSTTHTIVQNKFYTLSYNETYEQAEWVAYELRKSQLVNAKYKRPYFVQDHSIASLSADWKNYKNSGYDKGHLCPAADREYSKEGYYATFLTSNIAPQNHEFNSGIWNRLEQKIRYWAQKYNTLYVITGGVLQPNLKTIGYEKVAVPKLFYKIVLVQLQGEYRAIAFVIPNAKSDRPLYDYVVSVDRVEQLTGIDFFPKFPDALEKELEKKVDYKQWSFN